jgi:hypothetical protein
MAAVYFRSLEEISMKHRLLFFRAAVLSLFLSASFVAPQSADDNTAPATPGMDRLAKFLVGDWNTTETM